MGRMAAIDFKAKADKFLALHLHPPILVLPNAWDAGSAVVFESIGFPAIATTSAGVAFSLGFPDGENIGRDVMLARVREIAQAVTVPVTADMEMGYAGSPEEAAETARRVLDAGAVGLNIEDGMQSTPHTLVDTSLQMEKIRAIREAADREGVHLVINGRTDAYLRSVGDPAGRMAMTVERAAAYRKAGADCIFVPGVIDPAIIRTLVQEIGGPVNVLAGKGSPTTSMLERLGLARISMGSGPMRGTLSLVKRIGEELRQRGTYALFTDAPLDYNALNALFQTSMSRRT